MKKILLIITILFAFLSCKKSEKELIEKNVTTYFKSNSKGDFEVKSIELVRLDTITDLKLLNYLFNYYSYKAEHHLNQVKNYKLETERILSNMRLSSSLSKSLTQSYKSDFDEKMDLLKMHNDSAGYYNDLNIELNKLKPDSVKFVLYEATLKYNIINKDMTANTGEDMKIFLNTDYNIVKTEKLIEMGNNKFLKK